MRATFRAKLIAIVGMTAFAFAVVVIVSSIMADRVEAHLTTIRDRYVPQLEVGPQLESRFEALRRSLQDAVAANDMDALVATLDRKAELLERLAAARTSIAPDVSATLRSSIESYYAIAYDVSRRLIQGETGESLVETMARMQEKQASTAEHLKKATTFDRTKLIETFNATLATQKVALRVRIFISVASLILLAAFCFWVTRGLISTLAELTSGLGRFGNGDFTKQIVVVSNDELGDVASHANAMAENLRRHAAERDRSDWQKAGAAQLSELLRGELGPDEAAQRSVEFLVRRVGALAGALYLAGDDGILRLRAHSGLALADGEPPKSFRLNEGLVGRAAALNEVTVIKDVPARYLRVKSGLGESEPSELVLVPLNRHGKAAGVLELAFFGPCAPLTLEFVGSVRDIVVVTLEAAGSRAALHEVLEETRQQAEKLAAQEEELRANNEELVAQQQELRQANEELEAHRQTLSEQNAELEEAKLRVQQKAEELTKVSAYKSQFLANMSHELRTPLNSMLLLSQLLANNEERNLTPKQVEYCKTVHSAGKDLLSLINQVLDLAKIEAGRQELYLERALLRHFADHARSVFTPLANDKGLSLVVEISSGLPSHVVTDRHRLERILTNLIGNAIKFTDAGEVRLTIGRPSRTVQLQRADLPLDKAVAFTVSDTGIGIPRELQEQVFAPFEQLESKADRRYGGTGLGLAIARESANLLGGELRLESQPGKGSVFTVFLPESSRTIDSSEESRAVEATVTPHRVPGVTDDRATLRPMHPHLLVIEDDPVFAEQLVDIIRARKLQVLVAGTGQEGLSLARAHRPQGIILDVRLPDIDGWTVMELLRKDPETKSIPVHFISSVDTPERGFALGAIGYLTKPTTQRDLIDVVRMLAARTSEQGTKVLVVEDNAETGESLVQLLAGKGLHARHVVDGKEALAALSEGPFGCMILDLGLPDMDGLGLLEILRKSAGIDAPPVVVYTARSLTKEETRRLEEYVEAVVMKDGNSEARLLEELRLFVGHLKDSVPKSARPAAPEPRLSDVSLQGAKILLADDDMRTVYALSALLRGKGADVVVADNGRDALDILARDPDVDGVLMDIMMPEMDGYEAMRRLRREPRYEKLPVIALTAKAMKGERERCLEAGANDYLAKPVDGDRLLATLDSWIKVDNGAGRRG